MIKAEINYVEMGSENFAESQNFFQTVFGWTITSYGPEYSAFENSGVEGGFFPTAESVPPLVILYTEDLDAAEKAIITAGGVITTPQFDFPGGRRFHFQEPGGNTLAVWTK